MKTMGTIALIFFLATFPAMAQDEETPSEEKGFLDGLMDVLGDAAKDTLQEKVDEAAGTYRGRLGQIKLLERRGNRLVLEAAYEDVKRSDGVTIRGQVLHYGVPLEGFSSLQTPVKGREGRARLTISQEEADTGWGLASTEVESDQIELYLIRESHPDRAFGHIVYDLQKTWTGLDAPDVPPQAAGDEADDEAIELGEGEALEAPEAAESPAKSTATFVRPGLVLAPAKKTTAPAVKAAPSVKAGPAVSVTQTGAPAGKTVRRPITTSFDFYAASPKARWRDSQRAKLTFAARSSSSQGSARRLEQGYLSTGNLAKQMLVTRPPRKPKSWIEGRFPSMTLGRGVHFKAVVGFRKGAKRSDGVLFRVIVDDGSKKTSVARRRMVVDKYTEIDCDLTSWAGKPVRIILRVDSGPSGDHDYAVWVKPRLTTQ